MIPLVKLARINKLFQPLEKLTPHTDQRQRFKEEVDLQRKMIPLEKHV